jgi:hypothetical protein
VGRLGTGASALALPAARTALLVRFVDWHMHCAVAVALMGGKKIPHIAKKFPV